MFTKVIAAVVKSYANDLLYQHVDRVRTQATDPWLMILDSEKHRKAVRLLNLYGTIYQAWTDKK